MKSVAPITNALNNPFKYTDPTGYQTASAPGVVSWLGGGGGWGENGRGFAGNTNWNYFVPNTSYYKYYGNYDYDTYNWCTGYYEHHTLGGTEEESFDDVNRNIILPNAAVTITDIIWVGPDQNPYEYVSYWVNGKRWNSADGSAALQKLIDDALQGSGGQAGGGVPGWIGWTNNLATTVAYGAVKAGGSIGFLRSGAVRWYSNAWKGSQYVETYNLTKYGSGIGYLASGTGVLIAGINFMLSDGSWGDYGQLGVSLLSAGLTLDGFTAPAGIGIGIFDAGGGFNSFYNYLDLNQQLYNGTGGLILPLNGVPQYLQIK